MARRFRFVRLLALLSLALLPAAAFAQTGIAGVVRDTSGAVLPGVTVEASSPVLIEKIRTVVTDEQGLYKVVDLRPGTYNVTFMLTGFSIVKREDIVLTTNFTAQVNAELQVGSVEETITVSGQSPVVDVQNVIQRVVIPQEVADALPIARTHQSLAVLIPGMTISGGTGRTPQDVGGQVQASNLQLAIHGSRLGDFTQMLDGFTFNSMASYGLTTSWVNAGTIEEYTYAVGSVSVETPTSGVMVNLIPKQGGNTFAGSLIANYTNHHLQSNNVTDELRARGLPTVNELTRLFDVNPSFGGPLMRDKLWFHSSVRTLVLETLTPNTYYNLTPDSFVYTPDPTRRAFEDERKKKANLRMTWQIDRKNKVALYGDVEDTCICHRPTASTTFTTNVSPEATRKQTYPLNRILYANWTAPVTNRLLLEAGLSNYAVTYKILLQDDPPSNNNISVLEQSTNFIYRSSREGASRNRNQNNNYKASLSYVTGSHALKIGVRWLTGYNDSSVAYAGNMNYTFLNGLPRSIELRATPLSQHQDMTDRSVYAQDQWTVQKLTLTLGLRYDRFNGSNPENHLPPVQFVGARDFAAVHDVPNWSNVSPRAGVAYDVFGNGKTALKATVGRYLQGETVSFASANNPVNASVNVATRTWGDTNGNFIPDCDLRAVAANLECGPLSNANFGRTVITTRYADAVRENRPYNWEISTGLQHEIFRSVSVNASYFRRSFGNFTVTDNLAVTPSDYDQYCVTAPLNANLPGGGGNQICGLYDLNPSKVGQVNNLVTFAEDFGEQAEVYDGFDVGMSARLARGATVQGGLNMGRTKTNRCFAVDSPQQLRFCEVNPPFLPNVKFLAAIPIPWKMWASATFQSLPGPQLLANQTVTNAGIQQLGRTLSSGPAGTVPVDLIEPGTVYEARLYQVDLRVSRAFTIGRLKIGGNFDVYNALNGSAILSQNNTYGPAWRQPLAVLGGRTIKFGTQVDF